MMALRLLRKVDFTLLVQTFPRRNDAKSIARANSLRVWYPWEVIRGRADAGRLSIWQ